MRLDDPRIYFSKESVGENSDALEIIFIPFQHNLCYREGRKGCDSVIREVGQVAEKNRKLICGGDTENYIGGDKRIQYTVVITAVIVFISLMVFGYKNHLRKIR